VIFENEEDAKSITQEFRLKGKSDKVDWVAAANFFFENSVQPSILEADDAVLDLLFTEGALGLAPNVAREVHNHEADILSTSIFADATIHLTDAFDLTVGARISFDRKEFLYDAILGPGAFQHKPGGMNYFDLRIVEPENNNAYEVGLKTSFPNNKGYLNLAGFLYDYQDLQVDLLIILALVETLHSSKQNMKTL